MTSRLAFRIGRYSAKLGDAQLDRQHDDTLRLIEANGYEDGGWLGVDDESGNEDTRANQGKGTRPDIKWLLDNVARHADSRPVAVVGWKNDRLFRDVSEKERVYKILAKYPDVIVHTMSGIRNPKSASDRFVSTIETAGDQYYADAVREKVLDAQRSRRAKGLPTSGWAGYGHQDGPDGRRIVVDDEAEQIRQAMASVLVGVPLATIADEWNQLGRVTRRGGQWRPTTLRLLLVNPRLAGILTHQGKELGTSPAIEPIVDELTFRRVQGLIFGRRHGTRTDTSLLTGILHCSKCGGQLNSKWKLNHGVRYTTYYCRFCYGVQIAKDPVDQYMADFLFLILDDSRFRKALKADRSSSKILDNIAATQAEIDELESNAAFIPTSILVAKSRALNEELANLRRQLDVTADTQQATQWLGRRKELKNTWQIKTDREKRKILMDVIGSVVVLPGKTGTHLTPDRIKARLVPLRFQPLPAGMQPPLSA